MFDEATEALLGVPACRMKRELLLKYPALPQVLEQLVVGLRVSFSFQQPPPKRNAKQGHFTVQCVLTRCQRYERRAY